ncbi:MAG: HAD-IIB family hydrolase [Opitutales bacterium]|nr:HAD-IIB family hydrolase [Opitutales bacterium]MCH8539943.1 HAD-IIB family hydrolase [Opitutales bacterium]
MMKHSLKILCTDLDRTLFPNGQHAAEPESMNDFVRFVRDRKFRLIYNSGRSKDEILEGVTEFGSPYPDMMIGEVGTKIYFKEGEGYREETKWLTWLEENTPGWDVALLRELVLREAGARLQPEHHQNPFKVSFFLEPLSTAPAAADKISREIRQTIPAATTVYSVDETESKALFDILPAAATKLHALEYVRQKLEVKREEVFFSGDSGNDLDALTGGYCGTLVRNAIPEVQEALFERARKAGVEDQVYFCRGNGPWGNGYFVSGIMEGLAHFGFAPATKKQGGA